MAKEKIYISIPFQDYKDGEVASLNAQVSVLNCLKHFENIKEIRKTKTRLKIELKTRIAELLRKLRELEELLPNETYKTKEVVEEKEKVVKERKKTDSALMKEIEDELLEIRAKLRILKAL